MDNAYEENLVIACQNGEPEKFGELYDLYIRKIYDFIYYKTHHKETAEDITSAVFIKAFEKIKSFDHAKGSFSSWVYRIARNSVIDHYRTKKASINIDDVWDLSGKEDMSRDLDTAQKLEKVEKYINALNGEQRDIVMLRVWQEMPYKEIAEIMGKSEASCKMAFSRAMGELRSTMPLSLLVYFLFLKL
jgi:RNA polymerase sigma-70 factor (ECF subfamily)